MSFREIYQKYVPDSIRKFLWKVDWHIKVIVRHFPRHIEASMNYLLHNRDHFENQLIIATILKNEAENLKEWIEYHKLVGVEKFIIYDNESTDNTKEILQPYIDSGEVIYSYLPGMYLQIQAKTLDKTVREYRNRTQWMALIDVDEFIVPVQTDSILDSITQIEKDLGRKIHGLAVNWVMFGYSGHRVKPQGLVIENYMQHDGVHVQVKSILNPRMVARCFVHDAIYLFGVLSRTEKGIVLRDGSLQHVEDVGMDKIRIHHYYTKSYDEWVQKILIHRKLDGEKIEIPDFDPKFMSHHEDRIMEKYLVPLKKLMA